MDSSIAPLIKGISKGEWGSLPPVKPGGQYDFMHVIREMVLCEESGLT